MTREDLELVPLFRDHLFAGRSLIFFDSIHSTNLFLLEHPELLDQIGLVVMAKRQSKGIGRRGRKWEQGTYQHLFCSFVLRPELPQRLYPSVSLLVAVASWKAINTLGLKEHRLKWPNDILIRGKKLCGILCQNALSKKGIPTIIAGIGINCQGPATQFPIDLIEQVTTLEEQGIETTPLKLMKLISVELERLMHKVHRNGMDVVFSKWESLSDSFSRDIVFVKQGRKRIGRPTGLDSLGRLKVLDKKTGDTITIDSGEIEYLQHVMPS